MNKNHYDLSAPFFDTLKKVVHDVGIQLPDIVTPMVEMSLVNRFGPLGLAVTGLVRYIAYVYQTMGDSRPPDYDSVRSQLSTGAEHYSKFDFEAGGKKWGPDITK